MANNLRLCVRNLPPTLTQEELLEYFRKCLGDKYEKFINEVPLYFHENASFSLKELEPTAAFLSFPSIHSMEHFYSSCNGMAINQEGLIPSIEYAPIQRQLNTGSRDELQNTIEQDGYYQAFIDEIKGFKPSHSTAEIREEKIDSCVHGKRPPFIKKKGHIRTDISAENTQRNSLKVASLKKDTSTTSINDAKSLEEIPMDPEDLVQKAQRMANEARLKSHETVNANKPNTKKTPIIFDIQFKKKSS